MESSTNQAPSSDLKLKGVALGTAVNRVRVPCKNVVRLAKEAWPAFDEAVSSFD